MATDVVSLLTSASVRICGLALVAFVSLIVFRIRSSAARHAVWTVVLTGMLLQIPLGTVAPTLPLSILPILPVSTQPRVMESARSSVSAARPAVPASHAGEPAKLRSTSWRTTVTRIYLAISLLLFLRLVFGCWGVHKIVRGLTLIPSLGPDVFESARVAVPGSIGVLRPRILLPRAWRDWDDAKLEAVLAHERAHIQRYDWLTRLASGINVCMFWFHPLAWWIDRELARLAEEACDDVAVSKTQDTEEYAATLVDIARTAAANGGVLSWPVISMATHSNVAHRVNRILKGAFQVQRPFGRFAWAVLFVCSVPVIYLSAAVSLAPASRDSIALWHSLIPNQRAELLQPLVLEKTSGPDSVSDVASNQNPKSWISPAQSQREERPLAMCILLDTSGSMDEKRAEAMTAALAFVKALKPNDEICIFGFDDEVFNGLPNEKDFTSNVREMEEAISRIDARGGTAMRDAVETGLDHLALTKDHERKMLVLITDGYDTSSKISQEELLDKVKSSGVPVYVIGLLSERDPQRRDAARLALGELADASGGLALYPKNMVEVESISRRIANESEKR